MKNSERREVINRRKSKRQSRKRLGKPEQLSLFDNEYSTHQVPAGMSIILHDPEMTPFQRLVYWYINKKSNWKSGRSHALSYLDISKALKIKHSSQVKVAIKNLIELGWLEKRGTRKIDEPGEQAKNLYQVIHYKQLDNEDPESDYIPRDTDDQPLKCAVTDAVWENIAQGRISWRQAVIFISMKLTGDWGSGETRTKISSLMDLCNFTRKTINDGLEKLKSCSLIKKIGSFLYELLPPPSKPKRERTLDDGTALARVREKEGFYYSLNKKWRMHKERGTVELKKGFKYWVDCDWSDLRICNPGVYDDFLELSRTREVVNDLHAHLESI